ncbi:MAG: pilus assembly protein, partial [Myxococcaceae bacterium]
MKRSSPQRGQTLVLFVLSMLLLVLMVGLTLSFSMKIRERIELQTVADATAYSNAVATARTFNNIAVINRTEIAHMVAEAGAASLLSWASLYRAEIRTANAGFASWLPAYQASIASGCPCAWNNGVCFRRCQCGNLGVADLGLLMGRLQMEDARLEAVFQASDPMVGWQMRLHHIAAGALYASALAEYENLEDTVHNQRFANKILDDIVGRQNPRDAGWNVPSAGDTSSKELSNNVSCVGGGAVCYPLPATVAHLVDAAMGSRGFHFVTSRQLPDYVAHNANLLYVIFPPDHVEVTVARGAGFFGKPGYQYPMLLPYAPAVTAQDEGVVSYMYNHVAHGGDPVLCPAVAGGTVPVMAQVAYSSGLFPTPMHIWTLGADP